MRLFFFLVIFIFASKLLAPENFIAPKKKRISTSALKEAIAHTMGDIIKKSADYIVETGKMQQELLVKMSELIEQDQKSFFAKASAQQLQTYAQVLENLDQVVRDCQQKIQVAFSRFEYGN